MARTVCVFVAVLVLITTVISLPLLAQDAAAPTPPPATAPAAPDGGAPPVVTAEPVLPTPAPTQLDVPAPAKLPIFGREFFSVAGGSFEPNIEAPVPSNYLLGAGDTLTVACWYGTTEYERAAVTINPGGEIYLKRLGTVTVSGRTVAHVTDDLRTRYAKQFTKFELSVRVTGRRTIPIWAMGEVNKPGKYLLSSMATVFTALYAAGGPTDFGSLRTIRLMRNGKPVGADIDIYQYLLSGKDVSVPLEAGDTLFVPFTKVLVTLTGEVRRPALYELREEECALGAALLLAGGTTPDSAELLSIERVNAAHDRQTIDCTLPRDAKFTLNNGDVVRVQAVPPPVKNAVAVLGGVYRPGQFAIETASSVTALLKLAGGLVPDAYLEQAVLKRMRADGTTERLVVNLREMLAPGSKAEQAMAPGDSLLVYTRGELPELLDIVTVQGEVVQPGTFEYQPGMRVADVMKLAFGPTTKTYLAQAYLQRFPIAATASQLTLNLGQALAGDAVANLTLQPRDRLIVFNRNELPELLDSVSIQGEVVKPGTFPFQDGMRVADLIKLAFGPTTKTYLAQAYLYRYPMADTSIQLTIDLGKAISGDAKANLALQPRDRVVVFNRSELPEFLDSITVQGEVIKPGTYPYQPAMRIADLLKVALGPTTLAYLPQAYLYSYPYGDTAVMTPVDLTKVLAGDATANLPLRTRDRLVIKSRNDILDTAVAVDGEVEKPGAFPFANGLRVSDAVFLAGGLKINALLDRALLTRLNRATYTEELIEVSLREAMAKQPAKNLLLKEGDRLTIYPISQIGDEQFVTVDGAITTPGTYAYRGEMRVSHLLFLAKGLQVVAYAPRADLYRLRPDNTTEIISVDLTVAMKGALTDGNPLLRPRDRLHISRQDEVSELPAVKIDGLVRKPGRYPLTVGLKLSDLLHLAGGLQPGANPTVEVWREVDGKLSTTTYTTAVVDDKLTLAVDPFLQDKDLINVMTNIAFRDPTDNYVIAGQVGQPGSYPLYQSTGYQPKTLYQVLRTMTLQADAYVPGITIFRKRERIRDARQQDELVRYMRELDQRAGVGAGAPGAIAEGDAAKSQSVLNMSHAVAQAIATDDGSSISLVIPPRSMQQQTFGLSLAVDVETLMRSKGKHGDLTLMPGDLIVVPKTPETVTVLGGVMNNGTVRFQEKSSIDTYLRLSGGLAPDGDRAKTVVLRINGQVLPAKSVKHVNPGDAIIVPTKHIVQTIQTKGLFMQALKTLSEMALIALPFSK